MIGSKFDTSAYCQEPLTVALDHLSSVKFVLYSLARPALKIIVRSLFIQNETITLSNILSHLNSNSPVSTPPPEARSQRQKRTLLQRLIHFFLIGIPLAIFVGTLTGFIHLIKTISNDITTIIRSGWELYSMSQSDIKFYTGKGKKNTITFVISKDFLNLENPQLLPSRNIVIDGIINTGVNFYTRRFIYRKLGMFSFLLKPFMSLVEKILTYRVIKFCDQIHNIRKRHHNQTTAPSTLLSSFHNDDFDCCKSD